MFFHYFENDCVSSYLVLIFNFNHISSTYKYFKNLFKASSNNLMKNTLSVFTVVENRYKKHYLNNATSCLLGNRVINLITKDIFDCCT